MNRSGWTKTNTSNQTHESGASIFRAAGRWYAVRATGEVVYGEQNRGWKTITEAKTIAMAA